MKQLIFWWCFMGMALSGLACSCMDDSFFSLERFDDSALVLDFRYIEAEGKAEVVRIYKGETEPFLTVRPENCQLENEAIYHVYLKKTDPQLLDFSQVIRCRRLYQNLEEFTSATQAKGTNPQKYNAYYVNIKRNNQELVILRALSDQYLGKLKECLLLTEDMKDIEAFQIIKGRFRKGARVGKWVYYEFENDRWVKKRRRY